MEIPTESRKLRIAIIGGGIGGLTTAVALRDCLDIELDLYEQAAQLAEIGAGINVWPRTWEIIKSLGVESDLIASLNQPYSYEQRLAFHFRISDRKDGYTFHKLYVREMCIRWICLTLCEEEDESVQLFFENGAKGSYDLVIGGDGVKSTTRKALPNDGVFYTGTVAYRGIIPIEELVKVCPEHRALKDPMLYCGKSKHIVTFPMCRGQMINVVAFVSKLEDEGQEVEGPTVRAATNQEVLDEFSGWEYEVIEMLRSIRSPSCWVIKDQRPLQKYVSGRIALIGDAAHAMTPHLGAGAGQAMEDGYILGRLILDMISSRCKSKTARVTGVLNAYNSVRQPLGNRIQRSARSQGFLYELSSPEFDDIKVEGQDR